MTRKNLYAFTEPGGSYPGFVSVNDEGDGSVSVTVRSSPEGGREGPMATLKIPALDVSRLTSNQIKHMAERFLQWRLPENFSPDGGVSFEPVASAGTPYEHRREPVGTNLLSAVQAEEMVRFMIKGLAPAKPVLQVNVRDAKGRLRFTTEELPPR